MDDEFASRFSRKRKEGGAQKAKLWNDVGEILPRLHDDYKY